MLKGTFRSQARSARDATLDTARGAASTVGGVGQEALDVRSITTLHSRGWFCARETIE